MATAIPVPRLSLDACVVVDPRDNAGKPLSGAILESLSTKPAYFTPVFSALLSAWWDGLPTTLPTTAKTFWNNGGILARTD